MAMKPKPGAKAKPRPKVGPAASKPKVKVTKSRGSNTAKQIGDQNQREAYNSIRDTPDSKSKGASFSTSSRSKVSKEEVKSNKKWESKKGNMNGMVYSPASVSAASRKSQRSGGKGK